MSFSASNWSKELSLISYDFFLITESDYDLFYKECMWSFSSRQVF